MPPDVIPDKLSENVPQLVVLVLIVAAVLTFAWRLMRAVIDAGRTASKEIADGQERAAERHAGLVDTLDARHERSHAEQSAAYRDSVGDMAGAIRALTKQLDKSDDTFSNLAHEVHAMSTPHDDGSLEIVPGIPGGEPVPIFLDADELLAMELMTEQRPWTHAMHGIDALHAHGLKGDPRVLIAVLDTGVDTDHPDLAGVLFSKSKSYVQTESIEDGNGHGSHCTGTVCGENAAIQRIMGVAPKCAVIHYKVLSNRGSGSGQGIAAAIRDVANLTGYSAKIISGSFGSSGEDPTITQAVRYAAARGVHQIYAAGNSGPNSPNWPGMLPECIAVGASDPAGNVAPFSSSKDDYVDVTAGGVNVPSCYPDKRIAILSGTSMSTPLVAGAVGVAISYAQGVTGRVPTVEELKTALYETCEPHTPAGRDSRGGYGKLRGPEFADKLARILTPVAPPTPPTPPVDPKPPVMPGRPLRIAVPAGAKFVEIGFSQE